MRELALTAPIEPGALDGLRAGDVVRLSGTVYSARDAAHARLVAMLEDGEELPFPLPGAAIYYLGPCPAPPGRVIGSAGPTTSARMDRFMEPLLAGGLKAAIGKGPRSEEALAAMRKHGAAYLVGVGGAAALLASFITGSETIAFPELGPEAVCRLTVRDLPLLVACDASGGSVFAERKGT